MRTVIRNKKVISLIFVIGLCLITSIKLVALPTIHQVALGWTQSTSSNIDHDCVYRGTTTGGPYTKLICSPANTPITAYIDLSVTGGQTYFYVTTAVNTVGTESPFGNESKAVIPSDVLPNTSLQNTAQ